MAYSHQKGLMGRNKLSKGLGTLCVVLTMKPQCQLALYVYLEKPTKASLAELWSAKRLIKWTPNDQSYSSIKTVFVFTLAQKPKRRLKGLATGRKPVASPIFPNMVIPTPLYVKSQCEGRMAALLPAEHGQTTQLHALDVQKLNFCQLACAGRRHRLLFPDARTWRLTQANWMN